jgi:S-adenosylmethionine synthetase
MGNDFIFMSESVNGGHPDKLCDQISDAIVDRFLQNDPFSRVVAECAVSTAIVFIAARFASDAAVDLASTARQVISDVGYNQDVFNSKTCSIITSLKELPVDAARRVDEMKLSEEEIDRVTVKNQATVFGFACSQTPSLMPLPIWLAHKISKQLRAVRRNEVLPYLTPDGKIQVGIEFRDGRPVRIYSVTVIASQKKAPEKGGPDLKKLEEDIRETVITEAFKDEEIKPDGDTRIFVNPDGTFIVGGPSVHSGLTGRKAGVDTYGEYSRQSAAALSGKCPARIDRVGAYAARYAAKNIVAAGLAAECEVQLSYSIGFPGPVSIKVETFGTGTKPDSEIAALIRNCCDFRIAGIIKAFNLRYLPSTTSGGFYRKLATYGHVGRMDLNLPWERTDQAEFLRG